MKNLYLIVYVTFLYLCDVLSRHVLCYYAHFLYVRPFKCSCCVVLAHLPSITAADRHTPLLNIVCVCDTALLRLAALTTVNRSSNCCVPREYMSPHISVLPASNTKCGTYQINTNKFKATFNLMQQNMQIKKTNI